MGKTPRHSAIDDVDTRRTDLAAERVSLSAGYRAHCHDGSPEEDRVAAIGDVVKEGVDGLARSDAFVEMKSQVAVAPVDAPQTRCRSETKPSDREPSGRTITSP